MASRSVNKILLIGNLSRDAETKFTPSGVSVTKFSVATNRRWKDQQTNEWKEEVNYTNVTQWRAENVATYLTKGKQVYVEGRLQTRSYEDKDGKKMYATEVVADEVILLGGGKGATGASEEDFSQETPYAKNSRDFANMTGARTNAAPAPGRYSEENMEITDLDVQF